MVLELAIAAALGQDAEAAATKRDLERFEQDLAASWKAGDCAGWEAMLTPDWSVTHITGAVITKAQALEMCRSPRTPGDEDHRIDDVSVRSYGDTAVVTGRTTVTIGGTNPTTLMLRFTDVFLRRDGRWRVVASHATRLTP